MSRVIKFRAFDNKKKKMSGSFSLEDASYEGFPPPFVDKNGECDLDAKYVVQQFTGLLDKNGKEIYEGDVIRTVCDEDYHDFDYHDKNHEVRWDEGDARFCIGACLPVLWGGFESVEVVGNIYENPELVAQSV